MDQINNYRRVLWGSLSVWLLFHGCGTAIDRAMVAARTEQLFSPSVSRPSSSSHHDTALPELPTLQDYIRVGLLRNPDLRGDYERWRAALERVPQVTSLPDPIFSYGHFIEEIQTRTGP